jgi:hypothetical protein
VNKRELISFILKNKGIIFGSITRKDLKNSDIRKLEVLKELIEDDLERDRTRYIS